LTAVRSAGRDVSAQIHAQDAHFLRQEDLILRLPSAGLRDHLPISTSFAISKTLYRCHDLTQIFRMLDAAVPIAKVARIAVWRSTMARMAARYGHFAVEELGSAVESATLRGNAGIGPGILYFHPYRGKRRKHSP
jgi:hypothetical protein